MLDLPENPLVKGHGVFLVPKDILRELPVATDWSDIDRVVQHNSMLRDVVNKMLANITKATIKQKKRAIRKAAFSSAGSFQSLFDDFLTGKFEGYDFSKDRKSFETLRDALTTTPKKYPLAIAKPTVLNAAELKRIVYEITTQFKRLIENNDLSRLLWDGSTPRSEKSAQLVYFGVAESYCKANNVDISPEVHSGGGPVDFKFSTGYNGRILVELKLSKGAVVHGYTEQLEVYKTAAQTDVAIFLIINIGDMKNKLKTIEGLRDAQVARGERVTEIVVVDATRHPSASKRTGKTA
jgi:hypothetical protein